MATTTMMMMVGMTRVEEGDRGRTTLTTTTIMMIMRSVEDWRRGEPR